MLQIKNLSFSFKEKNKNYLIEDLNFKVNNGEIKLIYGKSGLGKSTLLNIITGIKIPNLFWTGKILLENQEIHNLPLEKRKIGLLMQERFLFPHFRVKENLMFAMPKHFSKTERHLIISLDIIFTVFSPISNIILSLGTVFMLHTKTLFLFNKFDEQTTSTGKIILQLLFIALL